MRLSGLLHWEERVAFREAARQLCAQFGLPFERSASHDENIGFFADVLAQLASAKRAAVFVLDELDAFARRSRQALLYNLCDRVSGARVAAALVGVSARIDCVDLLEKRVRSRFSGRVLYLPRPGGGVDVNADGDDTSAAVPAYAPAVWPPPPDTGAGVLRESLSLPSAGAPPSLTPADAAAWNAAVDASLATPTVTSALDEADFFGLLSAGDAAVAAVQVASVAALSHRAPTPTDITTALAALRSRQRDLVDAVRSASVLEVFVLACLARVAASKGRASFDAAWSLYASLGAGGYGPDADRGRGAAWAAFQRLVAAGLVTPGEGRAGAAPPTVRGCGRRAAPPLSRRGAAVGRRSHGGRAQASARPGPAGSLAGAGGGRWGTGGCRRWTCEEKKRAFFFFWCRKQIKTTQCLHDSLTLPLSLSQPNSSLTMMTMALMGMSGTEGGVGEERA